VLVGKADASATCQSKFSAALTKAGTCRFVDNGDGTVSDLNTGLQWEKKHGVVMLLGGADLADPENVNNLYEWSASGTAADGTAVTDFLSKLNNGASTDAGETTPITGCFAGHCDWRLPSIVELQGIVDITQGFCSGGSSACIDPVFGPTHFAYWTATTVSSIPTDAWRVSFANNGILPVLKTDPLWARAVRGGL
jgi:hypothetical protein